MVSSRNSAKTEWYCWSLQSETDQRSRYEQEELTRQLQLAVNAEDYEHAAEIRDRLRALLGKEEA